VKQVFIWMAFGLVATAIIVAVCVHQFTPTSGPPLAVRPAIASASFADSTCLDVLLHGEGSIADGLMTKLKPGYPDVTFTFDRSAISE